MYLQGLQKKFGHRGESQTCEFATTSISAGMKPPAPISRFEAGPPGELGMGIGRHIRSYPIPIRVKNPDEIESGQPNMGRERFSFRH